MRIYGKLTYTYIPSKLVGIFLLKDAFFIAGLLHIITDAY